MTRFSSGDTHNTIPQTAELQGTVRTFRPETRTLVDRRVHQTVEGAGINGDASIGLDYRRALGARFRAKGAGI